MNLYEIALPTADNSGNGTWVALGLWEHYALKTAGGYTAMPDARGAWMDTDGKVFNDITRVYRIACTLPQWVLLVAKAFVLFPDQRALFTANIGTAVIERPVLRRAA